MKKIAGWFYDVFIGDVIEFIIELAFLALLFWLFPNIDLDAATFAFDGIVMLGVLLGTIIYIRIKKRARKERDENEIIDKKRP